MSGRHQPLHGADSAESLIGYLDPTGAGIGNWVACAACSLPAVRDGLCAGHARLGEYRVTDEKHWAANE